MVDLNHIFLFIAVISPLLVLARTWRPDETHRGWRVAALIVLAITAASWIFFRHQAGYIGASVWFALLFVPAIGLRKMTELAAQHRYRSAGKLAAALQILHPSAELREQAAYFRMLQSENSSLPSSTRRNIGQQDRHYRLWNAPAVLVFILLNIAAFLFEISFGDWTDPVTLHRLGALEPYAVVARGEYWRLLTALFLHAGSAHLFFNLFALYALGPPLERSIGALRFAACYLIAGFGSSAGVVLLTVLG